MILNCEVNYLLLVTCRLQDLAGYGVALAVAKEFASAFPDRTVTSPLVNLLVKSGRNGNKTYRTIHMNTAYDLEVANAFYVYILASYPFPYFR